MKQNLKKIRLIIAVLTLTSCVSQKEFKDTISQLRNESQVNIGKVQDNINQLTKIIHELPKNTIIAWYSTEPIPNGWVLCNGLNGTPNLNGAYVYATTDASQIGKSIGATSHVHTFSGQTGGAIEGIPNGADPAFEHEGDGRHLHNHGFSGTTDPASNNPPGIELMFIMKL
jgi:hypothetical protein